MKASDGDIKDPTMNSMLQRWVMTNQNNDSDFNSEKYHDWLSMGPYYLFDFSRDANNTGTYLQVKINYANSQLPNKGTSRTDTSKSDINVFVCSLREKLWDKIWTVWKCASSSNGDGVISKQNNNKINILLIII